jgi:hypothetical protein
MRYDRQVIGYHACRKEVADRLLDGDAFRPSSNDWDWLGSGVYFWEFGHQRAYEWAQQWPRLQGKEFAVVGAILQLGNCLDLLDTEYTQRLADFAREYAAGGEALPPNHGPQRFGDCFLINTYCEQIKDGGTPFDTVRGLFQEGAPVIEGSEIRLQNHIQITVRQPPAIVGLFRPRAFTSWARPVAPEPTTRQAEGDG